MRHVRLTSLLLPAIILAACSEDHPPTAPTPPGAPTDAVASLAAGHKVVNSAADPGNGVCNATQCTLREAINDPTSTDITFASGLSGPITLAAPGQGGGSLVIDKALAITGPSSRMIIQRRSSDPRFRILRIGSNGDVQLTNLTLRNGRADPGGGGIKNLGSLALVQCAVTENASQTQGGGIENQGPLTLTRTTLSNNSAPSGDGGGIDNFDSPLSLTNSSVVQNSGGGIANRGGTLDITNSVVSNNSGTGIDQNLGRATLNHVRIAGNSGGGMRQFQGTTTLNHSTVAQNTAAEGGGIFNAFDGDFTIMNSTIVNNTASGRGGGIRSTSGDPFGRVSASVTVINSTISRNTARIGGGIENSEDRGIATVNVTNSTIARNSATEEGGGVDNTIPNPSSDASSSIFLRNSLVAQNTAPAAPDAHDAGARFSLIGDGSGSGITNSDGNQVGTHSSPINPRIGPLADNGGPTWTHALLAGSPAIDAASDADCPATDQRGVARPRGAGCDIGSYEK
jgi:CSLREA domain-containing protein